jgi:hypothetical protein
LQKLHDGIIFFKGPFLMLLLLTHGLLEDVFFALAAVYETFLRVRCVFDFPSLATAILLATILPVEGFVEWRLAF